MTSDTVKAVELVRAWQQHREEFFMRDVVDIVEDFAEWMLTRANTPPDPEMVERVAEALHRYEWRSPDAVMDGDWRIYWLEIARAAIAAMGTIPSSMPEIDVERK